MKINIKVVLLVFLIVGVAGISVAFKATSKAEFCKKCHEMESDYNAWATSVHKDVECVDCHIGSGAVNFITHKISSSKEIYRHLTNSFEVINAESELSKELPSENCIPCHKNPGSVKNAELIFEHKPHLENGLNCALCHNRIAHPGIEGSEERATMEFCVDCHEEKKATTACSDCHPPAFKNTKPSTHTVGKWGSTHGKNDLTICSYCHTDSASFCKECHGVLMPHPSDWKGAHSENVSDTGVCRRCHTENNACGKCHEPPDLHPSNWRATHPQAVHESGKESCAMCHAPAFCEKCHSL